MSTTAEKTDPRVKRTRKLIIEAFTSLMGEKSFDDITVLDIAARATVNRATFYAHFTDKYALVDALIGERFQEILDRHTTRPADTAEGHLRALFLAVAEHWVEVSGQCKMMYRLFESLMEAQIKRQLRENMREWLKAHGFAGARERERMEMLATVVTWSIFGAAFEWAQSGRKQKAEVFADNVLPLIAASVTAMKR